MEGWAKKPDTQREQSVAAAPEQVSQLDAQSLQTVEST